MLCAHFTPGPSLSSSGARERGLKMIEQQPHTSAPQIVTLRLFILVATLHCYAKCHLNSCLEEASGCKGRLKDTAEVTLCPAMTISI